MKELPPRRERFSSNESFRIPGGYADGRYAEARFWELIYGDVENDSPTTVFHDHVHFWGIFGRNNTVYSPSTWFPWPDNFEHVLQAHIDALERGISTFDEEAG